QEITSAEEKQKQFGTSQTLNALGQAREYAEKGNSFTAWTAARDLNKLFAGGETAKAKDDGNALLLGVAGAIVLITLAVLFLKRKGEPAYSEQE
ncbi:MAG: hypothetical protein V1717_02900, partial [Candidatus Micrarchaeota archaeon]